MTLIKRIEQLEAEKEALAEDIKGVFAEAKDAGYDTKVMRQLVKVRKLDDKERIKQEETLRTYMKALNMEGV